MRVDTETVVLASATDLALDALRLATTDPREGAIRAEVALRAALSEQDDVAAAIAERARGLAAIHMSDLDLAIRHLRAAVRRGQRARSTVVTSECRMTLAIALAMRGMRKRALTEIDLAIAGLTGIKRARAQAQKGSILLLAGRLDDALQSFKRAVPRLRQAGDQMWVQRALLNRAGVYAQRQQYALAEADLHEVERISLELGLDQTVASVQQNLGYVYARRGEIPSALAYFDRAEIQFRKNRARFGDLLEEFGELLLSVRLLDEAREKAEQAVEHLERERRSVYVPEARLLLARILVLQGLDARAAEEAQRATQEFARLGRPSLAAEAKLTALAAEASSAPGSRGLLRRVEHALDEPVEVPSVAALEARILAAKLATKRGLVERASYHLRLAAALRRHGPAVIRARAWYAEALDRQLHHDERGCERALRAGLAVLDDFQASLGATDVRAHVASHRVELAELGLRLALEDGSARRAFGWAERGRASHLSHAPVRPPEDPMLADALAELRLITHDTDEARAAGRPVTPLQQRQVVLERRIRDEQRRQRAAAPAGGSAPPPSALREALGSRAVLEYVVIDGRLSVISLVEGRYRLRDLGDLQPFLALADRLPFALHRMARRSASKESRLAAEALLAATARKLDALMVRPAHEIGDRPLVIVPTGKLQWLPWSVLPSCRGRPLTVAPSAAQWYAAAVRPTARGHVVVAAGPSLPGAQEEAEAVARRYGVAALTGADATVKSVSGRMTGAALAHLAAHGRVRADNPQFGSLRMHDGPLMIYDLERLDDAPHTVVVAACDAGRPVVPAGDELLGLTASLLSHGTAQLVASVLPILDAETAPLMVSFHTRVAAGEDCATALAAAQLEQAATGPEGMATAAGFLCFGAGFAAPRPVR
jgi:tetratricopeptide (TPR) repeat protein